MTLSSIMTGFPVQNTITETTQQPQPVKNVCVCVCVCVCLRSPQKLPTG
uniref:Uncharacterized protein n=1 Tax=Anguilla anguilla TaxID=7936 RepID=A0A0E9P6H1_ANGAN